MAIPHGWQFSYSFNNNASHFAGITEARGICPHCALATTFHVRSEQHNFERGRINLFIILMCNSAPCRKTLYVETSVATAAGPTQSNGQEPFFVHPSRAIEPPHASIPADIADDWRETQRSFVGGNPKATAMMLRRVLYGVLIDK